MGRRSYVKVIRIVVTIGKNNVNKRIQFLACTQQRHGLLGVRIFRQEACHPSGLGTNRLLSHLAITIHTPITSSASPSPLFRPLHLPKL
jgi:hypothetical protein